MISLHDSPLDFRISPQFSVSLLELMVLSHLHDFTPCFSLKRGMSMFGYEVFWTFEKGFLEGFSGFMFF
jgi:hypothetical protein